VIPKQGFTGKAWDMSMSFTRLNVREEVWLGVRYKALRIDSIRIALRLIKSSSQKKI